jgi:(E)-4-hydroxy-3-methylbut-2-enyl-diphosphate synthase
MAIAQEVEKRLANLGSGNGTGATIAVMGCVVNGPGEASRADYGIAGGDGEGLIFAKGKPVKKVPMDKLVDELFKVMTN